jgi:hypothetical protein
MLIYNGDPTTAGTDIQLPYCPAFLFFPLASIPTRLKVNVLGKGVILDISDVDLLTQFGIQQNTNPDATKAGIIVPLANGLYGNQNTYITIARAGVTPTYAFSTARGTYFYVTTQQTVLANSGYTFERFFTLTMAAVDPNDEINVTFADGTVQKMQLIELQALNQLSTTYDPATAEVTIDNTRGQIRNINYIPVGQRNVLITNVANL